MKSPVHAMNHTEWLLLILLSILWGGSFFFVGVAVQALPPLTIVALRVSLALLIDNPFASPLPGIETWLAITGLALISTALAYILYFRILATAGTTNVLLVTLLIPISAILFGGVFLNEQLELHHMLGMGLIGFGLLAIDGRLLPSRAAKKLKLVCL